MVAVDRRHDRRRLAAGRMTELTAAALAAMALSFVVFTTAAAWYAVP